MFFVIDWSIIDEIMEIQMTVDERLFFCMSSYCLDLDSIGMKLEKGAPGDIIKKFLPDSN